MGKWSEEHPLLMKTFELAVGTALSVASTVAVAFITGKMNEPKPEPPKPDISEGGLTLKSGDLETIVMIATDYAESHGPEWYKDANTVIDFQRDVSGQTSLKMA